MSDQQRVALPTESRDLHGQHVELTAQTPKDQAQMFAARQR
jgi:hypothetical protein